MGKYFVWALIFAFTIAYEVLDSCLEKPRYKNKKIIRIMRNITRVAEVLMWIVLLFWL